MFYTNDAAREKCRDFLEFNFAQNQSERNEFKNLKAVVEKLDCFIKKQRLF